MPEQPLAYERLPGESSEAFRAFTIYRDLGHQRTLEEVDRRLRSERGANGAAAVIRFIDAPEGQPKGTGKRKTKPGHIGRWSRLYRWVERAREWDDYIDRFVRQKQLDQIEQMALRQSQQAQLLSDVLMRPVVELAKALQSPDILADLTGVRDPMASTARLMTSSPRINDLWELAHSAAHKIPKLQEAERYARGVRVHDVKEGPSQGGTAVWNVEVYQPPREGPEPDFSILDAPKREEWDGDKVPKRRRGEDDD